MSSGRSSWESGDTRRSIARDLAAEFSVPIDIAYRAVRARQHERCVALAHAATDPSKAFRAAAHALSRPRPAVSLAPLPLKFPPLSELLVRFGRSAARENAACSRLTMESA